MHRSAPTLTAKRITQLAQRGAGSWEQHPVRGSALLLRCRGSVYLISCLTLAPCVRKAAAVARCGWQGTGQPEMKPLCITALQCLTVKPASLQPPVKPSQTSPGVPLCAFPTLVLRKHRVFCFVLLGACSAWSLGRGFGNVFAVMVLKFQSRLLSAVLL